MQDRPAFHISYNSARLVLLCSLCYDQNDTGRRGNGCFGELSLKLLFVRCLPTGRPGRSIARCIANQQARVLRKHDSQGFFSFFVCEKASQNFAGREDVSCKLRARAFCCIKKSKGRQNMLA